MVSRDDFLKTKERKYAYVDTAIGSVRIQSITEGERVRVLENFIKTEQSGAAEAAHMVCLSVVDEDGDRLFRDADVNDIMEMDSRLIQTIYRAIDKLCGVDTTREAERIEGTAKNLPTTNGDGSQSNLQTV